MELTEALSSPSAGSLGRSPLVLGGGGRVTGKDSSLILLSGVAMQESIRSAQAVGMQACAKHYIWQRTINPSYES